MANFQVTPPDNFNFQKPEEFDHWITRFERFKIASGLSDKDESQQVNTLIYCMGKDADDIFNSFNLSATQAKKFATVTDRYKNYFNVKRNVIYERAKFNTRRQQENETVDMFVTSLYTLSEHCQYGPLKDELIRDRLVVGIKDAATSEKLQLDADLSLEKAIHISRQKEAVHKQQRV